MGGGRKEGVWCEDRVVESAPRVGPRVRADPYAHDRVCSRHSNTAHTACSLSLLNHSCLGIWSTYHCHVLENGALHRNRLSSSARCNAPLSGWATTARA